MKKIFLIITGLLFIQSVNCQVYYPFPTDTSQWNCLFWHQWSPADIFLTNSQYLLQGDTVINGESYNKIYYTEPDHFSPDTTYIGGLREDSSKNIYFFPYDEYLPTSGPTRFPSDTAEYLLYTFNNLDSGMVLPIDTGATKITVVGIDSVLMGDHYRKRYKIFQDNLLGYDYWIEGIGSSKDLFIPFTYEFEWFYYTLCFTDTTTYYINSPNGEDSCHYYIPVGINEINLNNFKVFPNPASKTINIKTSEENLNSSVNIYNSTGQLVIQKRIVAPELEINIESIKPGLYMVKLITPDRTLYSKFIKE